MDNKFSSISFCREDYRIPRGSEYAGMVDEYSMWDDIKSFLRIAIKNGYQIKLWSDELTVVAEFNYADESLGGVSLEWLGEDEHIEKDYEASEDDE